MNIKRGETPKTITRDIDVEIQKDELLLILSQYVKRKYGNDRLKFDDLNVQAAASADNEFLLTAVTLIGIETLPLQWPPEGEQGPVRVAVQPTGVVPNPPSNLPEALKTVQQEAAKQAATAGK
jgi:hypothetical protein